MSNLDICVISPLRISLNRISNLPGIDLMAAHVDRKRLIFFLLRWVLDRRLRPAVERISNDPPAHLKAYAVSDESVRREANALQALVADDPLQSLRAGHLTLTSSTMLDEIDEMVKTTKISGVMALAAIRSIDEICSQIDQMVDDERFLLAKQENRADALERL